MKRPILLSPAVILLLSITAIGQVPIKTAIQILKAEDARRYDRSLEDLLASPDEVVRGRAALAAGRIGKEAAIPALVRLLDNDASEQVRAMAAFALGEIESIKGADVIVRVLTKAERRAVGGVFSVTARTVEAAGKIAAANPKDEKSKQLLEAILTTLDGEDRRAVQDRDVVLLALTAAGRAGALDAKRKRPDDTDFIVAKFLKSNDARIRTDAANTLTRLRSKNANAVLRTILENDTDPTARANAARALGATEDKEAIDILQQAAVGDDDLRVRVSAIRSLGNLKDAKSGSYLVAYGEALLLKAKREGVRRGRPVNLNELLEVVTSVGRLLQNTDNKRAVQFLENVRLFDEARSPETEIALARIAPDGYIQSSKTIQVSMTVPQLKKLPRWQQAFTSQDTSNIAQGLAELANSKKNKDAAKVESLSLLTTRSSTYPKAVPDVLRSYARFKSDDLQSLLKTNLLNPDVFIRTAAAELLAEQPASKESVDALKTAFVQALLKDKFYNDAQLAIMDALRKLDRRASVEIALSALVAPDYLVRKKAFELLDDETLFKDFPGLPTMLESSRKENADHVKPYTPIGGTRLGQILNRDADYRRALSRKNGSVEAVLTTEKGTFTIDFFPEEAPLTVDNFIKLALAKYFNGLEVHRVVPNFVMQDGDPRGDGNGGPGWSIRCEINTLPYERGAVGMALSGKDTGGSQWFVTHSPQPHLDGGYTVFGRVNETDMKVVDSMVRGDKIISIRIVETKPKRTRLTSPMLESP